MIVILKIKLNRLKSRGVKSDQISLSPSTTDHSHKVFGLTGSKDVVRYFRDIFTLQIENKPTNRGRTELNAFEPVLCDYGIDNNTNVF